MHSLIGAIKCAVPAHDYLGPNKNQETNYVARIITRNFNVKAPSSAFRKISLKILHREYTKG